ncbi:MAG: type II secretion system protein GspD [Gammaproteobacteria bacterium]
MNVLRSLLLALATVGLTACASARTDSLTLSKEDKASILTAELARLDAASEPQAAKPAVPKPVEILEAPKRRDPLDRRVTLTAGGAPLNLLLSRLADLAGLRLVTEREAAVTAPVSVNFHGLPIREALEAVLTPQGLFSRVDEDSLVVFAFDTRGWTISLPAVSLSATTSITNETGGTVGVTTQQNDSTRATAETAAGTGVNLGPRAEVATRVTNISTWTELDVAVKAIASKDGTVMISPALGLVTVRDRPDRLSEIDRFLARLEAAAAQQIAVEVRAFEVTLNESDSYGIDWSRVWKSLVGNTALSVAGSFATPLTLPIGVSLSEPGGLNLFIRALSTQGEVKVLSQPSIRLLNGHPAVIQAGRVRAFVAEASQTVTGAAGTSTFGLKLGSVQDGVILPLTARIVQNEVVLNLAPILSQVREIRKVTSGRTSIEAPDVDNRALQTTVRLRNGETVVLGGLISSQERDERQGLPIVLKYVPILGWLFGSREKSAVRTELVLTLTPTIVPAVATRPS